MIFWLRYVTRSLRRSGRRSVFALLCIVVGVASVVALQTATLTVQNALTSNVRAANGGDISVASEASPISQSDLAVFSSLQRQGQISQWTAVANLHAAAVSAGGHLVPFDIQAVSRNYPIGGQPTFVSPSSGNVGTLLTGPRDVLVTTVLADELGVSVGSRVYVRSVGGQGLHATIRGILAETSFEHSAVMTMRSNVATALSGRLPEYSAVYLNVPGNPSKMAAQLRSQFPVATVQTVQEAMRSTQQQVHDFQQFMLLVGLMALLIAGIGILNAMQSMLTWRRLEIAMLKAVGFRRRSLYVLFGGEALLLGLVGGAVGAAIGASISKAVTDALARAMAIQVVFKFDTGSLLGGVALGIGATLLFSLMPIVRAAGFRPLEILREGTAASATGWAQTLGLLAIVLALFAGLSAAIMGSPVLAAEFVIASAALAALFTGLFALIVSWIGRLGPPRSRLLGTTVLIVLVVLTAVAVRAGSPLGPILGLAAVIWGVMALASAAGRLPLVIAVRSLSRRRARTSVTLVAFLVGVLAMSVTLTVAVSLESQINAVIASNSSVNLVAIASPSGQKALLKASSKLKAVQSRSDIVEASTEPVQINRKPLDRVVWPSSSAPNGDTADEQGRALSGVTGLDLRHNQTAGDIRIVSGRMLGPADTGSSNALVRSELLYPPYNLKEGDSITLREPGSGRTSTIRIAGFYDRTRRRGFASFFRAPIYADRSVALAVGGQDAQFIISYSISPDQLTHDATQLQRQATGSLVVDIGDLTAVVETILNELLNLLAVITALGLGAGLAVVGNGVALAMLERRREMALYKAIGFGPRSVLRFVLVENALGGTLAGAVSVVLVAAVLSVISHLALQKAIGFDPVVAVLVLAGATLLAVVTAYLAARAPVRIRPIEVLRNE